MTDAGIFRPKIAAAVLSATGLMLAACESVPGARLPAPARSAGAAAATIDGAAAESSDQLRIGVLGPRDLASGRCGLFLWTRATPPELVFFADPESGQAAVVLDGRERALSRLSVDAPVPGGRPGAQTFASASGDVSVRLTVQETEAVDGGYRVASASLRFADVSGWSGVAPVAGLAACQP